MNYRNLLILVVVAVISACGSLTGEGTYVAPRSCNANADCVGTDLCHPTGFVCVKSCTVAADCTGSENVCAPITDLTGASKSFCKCTSGACTDTTDSAGVAVPMVCSVNVDDICEKKCTTAADCTGYGSQSRTCGASGFCVVGSSSCTAATCNTAGASVCNSATGKCEGCTTDAQCSNISATATCNKTTKVCETTATCSTTNKSPGTSGGPDICSYAQVCLPTGCSASLPDGSCSDYSWNKSLQGPVITSAVAESFTTSDPTLECGGGTPKIEVQVDFYAPGGLSYTSFKDFLDPTACAAGCLGHFEFTNTSGKIANKVGASFIRGMPSSGSPFGSFTAGLCTANFAGRAVWIVDGDGSGGNAVCLQ